MPELPEVETIRAHLAPRVEGRTIVRAEILDPRLTRPHDLFEVAEELEGDRVVSVERRGKYLLLRLESGFGLLVHLRMTGGFHWQPVTHERAVLELDDGTRLAYRDVRRFGTWLVLEDAELEPYLATKNGPEPLGRQIHRNLAGRAAGAPQGAAQGRAPRPAQSSPGSGTSTRTRRSGARGSTPCAPPVICRRTRSPESRGRFVPRCEPVSRVRDPPCATTSRQTVRQDRCRTSSASTAATDSPAVAVGRPSPRPA